MPAKENVVNKNIYTDTSEFNALTFVIKNMIDKICTALPVKVVTVNATTGFVDVLPLITFLGADGNTITPVTLYHLPYCRIQGGIAALITDPIAGDIGLAVFAQRDSSSVAKGITKPVKPNSYRTYDMADGFYIGGFVNQTPTCYLELKQDNTAILNATGGTTINATSYCRINASGGATINGNTTINGDTTINGNLVVTSGHTSTMNGNISVVGGDVVADSISLKTHTHGGVETGSGNTGGPQ